VLTSAASKIAGSLAGSWRSSRTARLAGAAGTALYHILRQSRAARIVTGHRAGESRTLGLLAGVARRLEKRLGPSPFFARRALPAAKAGSAAAAVIIAAAAALLLPPLYALAAAAAGVALAAIVFWPEAGLMAGALMLPFVPFKVLCLNAGLTLASCFLHTKAGSRPARLFVSPLALPAAALLAVMAAATVTSVLPLASAGEFLIPVAGVLYAGLMVALFDRREKLENFVFCLVLSAVVAAGYAIYQYYTGASALEFKREWVDVTQNTEIKNRAYALFENPNLLAQYACWTASVSLGALLGTARRARKIFFGAACVILVMCLGFTFSRGGWLSFLAALAVTAAYTNGRLILLPACLLSAWPFLPRAVVQRLSTAASLKDSSNAYRLDTWRSTLSLISEHWETGVGLGRRAFARVYQTHAVNSNVVPHSHNLYLQTVSEFGILGLAVLCWFLAALFFTGVELVRSGKPLVRGLNAGIMGALAGFLVHSLVDYFLWYYKLAILLWMCAGALAVMQATAADDPSQTAFTGGIKLERQP